MLRLHFQHFGPAFLNQIVDLVKNVMSIARLIALLCHWT